jgi:hypothetical protein
MTRPTRPTPSSSQLSRSCWACCYSRRSASGHVESPGEQRYARPNRQKFAKPRAVHQSGQSWGRRGSGRRGRLGLQPRSVSEIFVTGIVLVTLALTGVAAAATPDRAPAQGAATAGPSPAPDPVPQPVRVSPTQGSTPPVTVTPVSSAPSTTSSHSAPATSERATSTPVERPAATPVEPARPESRTPAPARKHHPPAARQQHRATGPVRVNLALPRISPPKLVASGREPEPNGVLLLLSSLSLGLLVVASLTLLRRVKRLNGGWWA